MPNEELMRGLLLTASDTRQAKEIMDRFSQLDSLGERIAYLQDLFELSIESRHNGEGTTDENSLESDYTALLAVIVSGHLFSGVQR